MTEVLPIIAWPLCVFASVVFVGWYFRRELRALIDRMQSIWKARFAPTEQKGTPLDNARGREGDGVPPLTRGLRFFVTTPLSGIGTQDQYDAFMAQMKPILTAIRSINNVDDVYYFNEHVPTIRYDFQDKWSVPDYINRLDQADYVVVILNSNTVSAVYFEAGYALGRGIKAIHFVGPQAKIPLLMKQCAFVYPKCVRNQTFNSLDEIPELLMHVMPVLQDEDRNEHLTSASDPWRAK